MNETARQRVRARAANRCEYCRLRQEHAPFIPLQIEHVIPRKHGGSDDHDNLALACIRCNLGKSSNLTGRDLVSGEIVVLFNPRTDSWEDHFEFQTGRIVGITPVGKVTAQVLNMNEEERIELRLRLIENGELD